MGCICPLLYVAVFLVVPVTVAAKAARNEHGVQVRPFLQFVGAYFGGVLAAAGSMDWMAFVLELERELGRPCPYGLCELVPKPASVTVRGLSARMRELLGKPQNS